MVARDALEVYRKNVIKIADSNPEILLLLTDQDISMYHEDFKKKAFEYFEEHQMPNGSDFNSLMSEVRALKFILIYISYTTFLHCRILKKCLSTGNEEMNSSRYNKIMGYSHSNLKQ